MLHKEGSGLLKSRKERERPAGQPKEADQLPRPNQSSTPSEGNTRPTQASQGPFPFRPFPLLQDTGPDNERKMSRQGKRRYREELPHQHESDVDDLLVASEAVRSTWVQTKSDSEDVDASVESTDVSITSDNGQSKRDDDDDDVNDSGGNISGVTGNEVALGEDEDCEQKDIDPAKSPNQRKGADIGKDSDFQQPQSTSQDLGEDDDESDIDLSQDVVEDDEHHTSVKSTPRTHNEIDPFRCPTAQLRQLNVSVDSNAIESLRKDRDGSILLDEEIKTNLRLSGSLRTYLPEQRTVVVDSFIPLKSKNSCEVGSPLDEGSLLVILTKEKNHGDQSIDLVPIETLSAELEPCQVQVLGPIMEVFGPVARPLYAIRLPDAIQSPNGTKEEKKLTTIDKEEKDSNEIEISENDVEEPKETESAVTRDEDDNQTPIDPWAKDGKLCKLLKCHPNVAIFCLMNHAKLIDTDHIIRVSGKGCDASNIYDEEPGANEPQYFSDDEQERQSKRRNNKAKSSNHANAQQRDRHLNQSRGGRGRGGRGSGRGRGRGLDSNQQSMPGRDYPQQLNQHWRSQHTQIHGHPTNQNQYLPPRGQHDQSQAGRGAAQGQHHHPPPHYYASHQGYPHGHAPYGYPAAAAYHGQSVEHAPYGYHPGAQGVPPGYYGQPQPHPGLPHFSLGSNNPQQMNQAQHPQQPQHPQDQQQQQGDTVSNTAAVESLRTQNPNPKFDFL